jgi:hypothetical protein
MKNIIIAILATAVCFIIAGEVSYYHQVEAWQSWYNATPMVTGNLVTGCKMFLSQQPETL